VLSVSRAVRTRVESLAWRSDAAAEPQWRGNGMATGTVKWFSDEKGYGFIAPEDGSEDVFVHHSSINGSGFKSLAEGAKVEYEVQQGAKGLQAVDVTPSG
jgi:CspA family cold shock protein